MIKLFSLKQKAQADAAAGIDRRNKIQPAQIRVQKDLSELEKLRTVAITFPEPDNILDFVLTITPDEGFYTGGRFVFSVNIKPAYPHEPPKVLCMQKLYHPNIDHDGNVCLNILREDWKPVLNINSVVVGMQYLFLEPNADDPLNKDAATVLRADRTQFARNVTSSMRGGTVNGERYDNVLVPTK